MPQTRSVLLLAIVALANCPLVKGENNASSIKDFNGKMRAIKNQMVAINLYTLDLPLRGRKRLELLTSLKEDYVPPTVDSTSPVFMQLFNNVKQMVEKSNLIKTEGQRTYISSFRTFGKVARTAFKDLKVSYGASSGSGSRTRTFRKPIVPPTPGP